MRWCVDIGYLKSTLTQTRLLEIENKMRNKIVQIVKGPRVARATRALEELYASPRSAKWINQFQTKRFNQVWGNALANSPFYRQWAKRNNLPAEISYIEDLHLFPVLTKKEINDHHQSLVDGEVTSFYVTGGSTGEPTKFPKSKAEQTLKYANRIITYGWIGLEPGDRYVHLWGHSHLFGQGHLAELRRKMRTTKDWVIGGHRLSAYQQSSSDIEKWVAAIERVNPKFIIGYTSALVNLARTVEQNGWTLYAPNLTQIVVTAETITPSERSMIEETLGVPVFIEYGAVEAGIIAHSRRIHGDTLQFLWGSLAGNIDDTSSLRITTLDPRLFPLINYDLGDTVEGVNNSEQVLSLQRVLGRTRDRLFLRYSDGTSGFINMLAIVQPLNDLGTLDTIQAAQSGTDTAEIYLTSRHQIDLDATKTKLLQELKKANIYLAPSSVTFKQLVEPVRSLAGKTNLVIPRQDSV
jgi:phenylacetate-coenzyme A ligase PaaK-like adenylate-forming protein